MPQAAAHPAAPGFHRLTVKQIDRESADVLSLTMQKEDGGVLPPSMPGQYVVVRLRAAADSPPFFRSYSISGPPSTERYRISVKIEPNGAAGTHLSEHVRVGDALDVSSPRGSFVLQSGERPVVLLSAGIGATPVLAMLYTLASARGIAAHWDASTYRSILELAEACDVPVRWACRAGVCHNCESGLVSGSVVYGPEPLDKPAEGNALVCCSQPAGDVVIDL